MESWSRMGRLVYMIGDREAAQLLRVRAQNLARNRLMESLGGTTSNAHAQPKPRSAQKPSAAARSRLVPFVLGRHAPYDIEKRQGIGPCSLP